MNRLIFAIIFSHGLHIHAQHFSLPEGTKRYKLKKKHLNQQKQLIELEKLGPITRRLSRVQRIVDPSI